MNDHSPLRIFFVRGLAITAILVMILLFLVPLVMYFTSLTRYEDESKALVNKFVANHIGRLPQDILKDQETYREVRERVATFMSAGNVVEFKIWDEKGTVVFAANDPGQVGKRFPTEELLRRALATGESTAETRNTGSSSNLTLRDHPRLVVTYSPLRIAGAIVGAAEVYRLAPDLNVLGDQIMLVVATAFLIMILLFLVLYAHFKSAAADIVESDAQAHKAYKALGFSYFATLRSLVKALEVRDMETEGHSERVVAISLHIGRKLNLSQLELAKLALGSYLHDIGKIGISDTILLKPALLTGDERITMQTHVRKGIEIVRNVPFLSMASEIIRYHHERWDGKGYPFGLKGEEIPLAARIFAVADVFDALINDRPYRDALPFARGKEILLAERGHHFEPAVVDVLIQIEEEEYMELYREVSTKGVHHSVSSAIDYLLGHYNSHTPEVPEAEPSREPSPFETEVETHAVRMVDAV